MHGGCFSGEGVLIEKYGLVYSKQLIVNSDKEVYSKQLIVNSEEKTSLFYKLKTTNYKLIFWWLRYPYRYYCGLKGFWYVVTGTSTSSVSSTEKRKEK